MLRFSSEGSNKQSMVPGRFQKFLASQLDSLLDRVLTEHKQETSALEAEVEILQKRLGINPSNNSLLTEDFPMSDPRSCLTSALNSPVAKYDSFVAEGTSFRLTKSDGSAPVPSGFLEDSSKADRQISWDPKRVRSEPKKPPEGRISPEGSDQCEELGERSTYTSNEEKRKNSKNSPAYSENLDTIENIDNGGFGGSSEESTTAAKFKLLPAWEHCLGHSHQRKSTVVSRTNGDNDSLQSPDPDDDGFGRKRSGGPGTLQKCVTGLSDALSDSSSLAGDVTWSSWIKVPVAMPSSKRNIFWKIAGFVLIMYDVAVVPMEIFNLPENLFLEMMMWMIRMYWIADLVLCFTTGYFRSQGSIEMRFGKVARHYLRTWLIFDIVLILCDWLVLFSERSDHDGWRGIRIWRVLTLLRVVRLFRLAKAPEIEGYISEHIRSERTRLVASIAKIISILVSIAHIIACAWYGLGTHVHDSGGQSWLQQYDFQHKGIGIGERYAVSVHWSLAQFMGENIITLHHVGERIFAIVTLLFAFVSSAVFVSSITTLMTKLQLISSQQSSQFAKLRRYLLQNNISTSLAVRVLRNAHHHFQKNSLHATEENVDLLKTISHSLQMEVRFEVYFPIIEKHPFFQRYNEVNPVGIRKVTHRALTSTTVFPGDLIFSQDETPEHPKMYFLLSGHLSYFMDGLQAAKMAKGSWGCEPVLWTSWIHLGTLQATTEATVLNIEAKTFQQILSMYPSQHAYKYGAQFVVQLNSHTRMVTDLAGVDLAECLCEAFAGQEESPKEVLNAWSIRGSISSSTSKRTSGRRGPRFSGSRRNSRDQVEKARLSIGLAVVPWNEGGDGGRKPSFLKKMTMGSADSQGWFGAMRS